MLTRFWHPKSSQNDTLKRLKNDQKNMTKKEQKKEAKKTEKNSKPDSAVNGKRRLKTLFVI